jgi:hypothetical protein
MRKSRSPIAPVSLALAVLMSVSLACYHTIIDTGMEPGQVGYHEKWETAWLVGLVPAEVDAEAVCGGPWARVETQQSFLNGLVTFLTLGIYAPHEVEVTCAARGSGSSAPETAEVESPDRETPDAKTPGDS